MAKIPKPILELARVHHEQLRGLEAEARRRVRRELERALERLTQDREFRRFSDFEAFQASEIEILARLTADETGRGLEEALSDIVGRGLLLAPTHAESELLRWVEYFGGESRPLNLAAIGELSRTSLIEQIPASLERWGPDVARRVRRELTAARTTRTFGGKTVDALRNVIDAERWKADRIFRTELFNGYNAAHLQSLEDARDVYELPVKKSAIATFDGRTDDDSYPVHGQVRELEENFVDGDGRSYLHPPGRPNDREKEIPWFDDGDDVEITPLEEGIQKVIAERERNAAIAGRARAPGAAPPVVRLPVASFEGRRQRMILSWTNGSNSRRAVGMKEAARQEFGLDGTIWNPRGRELPGADELSELRRDMRRTYEETQAFYSGKKAGSVRLYRGVKTDVVVEGTLEAWTDDPRVARAFAGRGGEVIVADIDTRRLFATVDGPGWINGRYGDQREFLVLSDPPKLAFDLGDWQSGPFRAGDLDPNALEAGPWGVLVDSSGRARLEHIPSGRTILEGREFSRDALVDAASYLDRSGMFDARGITPLGESSLSDAIDVLRIQYANAVPSGTPAADTLEIFGERFGLVNQSMQPGAAGKWSRRTIETLVDGTDGYRIEKLKGVISGKLGVATDGAGAGDGYFHVVHLPTGKKLFTGGRTFYSAGYRVPVDLGGFSQAHMKEIAERLAVYFDAETGAVLEESRDELEKILSFLNVDDPFKARAIAIKGDGDIDVWFREALGELEEDEDDFDPFLDAISKHTKRTSGPSPGYAKKARASMVDSAAKELSPEERFENAVEERMNALRRGHYNRYSDPDFDRAVQEEASKRRAELELKRINERKEELGFDVGDGRGFVDEARERDLRRELEERASKPPEYDSEDSRAELKRKQEEAEQEAREEAERRKAEREAREARLEAERLETERLESHRKALELARREADHDRALEENRLYDDQEAAIRENKFRKDWEAALIEEERRRKAAEFDAVMSDAIKRNEAFDKFTAEIESAIQPISKDKAERWAGSSIKAKIPGEFKAWEDLERYEMAQAGRKSGATLEEIAEYRRARELEYQAENARRTVLSSSRTWNEEKRAWIDYNPGAHYHKAEERTKVLGGVFEKNGVHIDEALANAPTWADAKKVLEDYGIGTKANPDRYFGGEVPQGAEAWIGSVRNAPLGVGAKSSPEEFWELVQRPLHERMAKEWLPIDREATALAIKTQQIPELHVYHAEVSKVRKGWGDALSERGIPGDHWGSADKGNVTAKGVAFATGNKYRPIDNAFDVYEAELSLEDALNAEARYRYAQREIAKVPREHKAYRGMQIPESMVKALADKSTKELKLTGCTALSMQRGVAEHYLTSSWTSSLSAADAVPVLMEVERDDLFDRNVAMLHQDKNSAKLPFEILNGLPRFKVTSVKKEKINGVTVYVMKGKMLAEE